MRAQVIGGLRVRFARWLQSKSSQTEPHQFFAAIHIADYRVSRDEVCQLRERAGAQKLQAVGREFRLGQKPFAVQQPEYNRHQRLRDLRRCGQQAALCRVGSPLPLPNGTPVRVEPVAAGDFLPADQGRNDTSWNDLKKSRRCELVDREIDGTLLPDEATELAILQRQMLAERRRLAAVPLEELRRLHQELLATRWPVEVYGQPQAL